MIKKNFKLTLASLILASSCAYANETSIDTVFQVTGTSNYHVRGITQTSDKSAIQGDLTLVYGNFYTGIWASNIDLSKYGVNDADTEIDYYLGYANGINNFSYSATYAKYTYPGSKLVGDIDELKFDLSYSMDKLTLGAKYELEVWKEDNSDKVDYLEAYTSYDFDFVNLNLSSGSFKDMGDNYKVGFNKTGKFNEMNLDLSINYIDFNAHKQSSYKDDNFVYGEIKLSI